MRTSAALRPKGWFPAALDDIGQKAVSESLCGFKIGCSPSTPSAAQWRPCECRLSDAASKPLYVDRKAPKQ